MLKINSRNACHYCLHYYMYTKPGTQSDSVVGETESHHSNTASGSAKCQSAPVEGE